MVIQTLKTLRHETFSHHQKFWRMLGKSYRYMLRWIGGFYSSTAMIGSYGPFKLHPQFAFSQFEKWGTGHNNGFTACVNDCSDARCFLDVGAHIGLVSLPASRVMNQGGKIIAFEPADKNRYFLCDHIRRNNIKNIQVCSCLIGDENNEETPFFEMPCDTGMNSIIIKKNPEMYNKTYKSQVTLDSFCGLNNIEPQIIKIDVEGSEMKVLRGAKNIIKKCRPRIYLSVHPKELQLLGICLSDLLDLIHAFGYEIYEIGGGVASDLKLSEYLLLHGKNG